MLPAVASRGEEGVLNSLVQTGYQTTNSFTHGAPRQVKKTNEVKNRVLGKARSGIPMETRKKIAERVTDAKRSFKIDISDLGLPYIPKNVTDSIYITELIADHNLLDEIEHVLGRLAQLKTLSLSWNRIVTPFPIAFYVLYALRIPPPPPPSY